MNNDGTALLAQIALGMCALSLLLIHFSGWRSDSSAASFVTILFILTVAALTGSPKD